MFLNNIFCYLRATTVWWRSPCQLDSSCIDILYSENKRFVFWKTNKTILKSCENFLFTQTTKERAFAYLMLESFLQKPLSLYIKMIMNEMGFITYIPIRWLKKKPCFTGLIDHFFLVWENFFLICQNLVKSANSWPKFENLVSKMLKINQKIFQRNFCKKVRFFFKNSMFFG